MAALTSNLRLAVPKLVYTCLTTCIRENCNRAAVTKVNRTKYARAYPTLMVQPDGSTITVRHNEPRKIITMPLDLTTLTQEERQKRLAKRKPKRKIIIEEDIDDGFDANSYSHLWKNQ